MTTAAVALSGSGFLFPCHVGALSAMERAGIELTELAGTSGGAMVAALRASGIDCDTLKEIVEELDTGDFMKFNFRALFKLGLSLGKNIEQELKTHLRNKTFSQMEIPLTIVATDVTTSRPFVFNSFTTPDFPVWKAVRASIAIPFVLTPVKDLEFYGPEYENLMLLDGGMVNNIPVKYLNKENSDYVFGVHLVNSITEAEKAAPFSYSRLALRLVSIMLGAQEALHLEAYDKEDDNVNIIKVDTDGAIDMGKELSYQEKATTFNLGFQETFNTLATLL